MNVNKFEFRLQLLANVGVALGLVLVGLQMRQNEKLMQMQIMAQHSQTFIAAEASLAGENVAEIWQKSVEDPLNLSFAEMRALESQTYGPLVRLSNLYRLYEMGLINDAVWKSQVDQDANWFFGNVYGRAWWEFYSKYFDQHFLPEELREAINDSIGEEIPDRNFTAYTAIKQIIREKTQAPQNQWMSASVQSSHMRSPNKFAFLFCLQNKPVVNRPNSQLSKNSAFTYWRKSGNGVIYLATVEHL